MALEDLITKIQDSARLSKAYRDTKDFFKSDVSQSVVGGLLQKQAVKKGLEAGQAELQEEGRKQSESGKKLYESMLDKLRRGDFVSQAQRDLAADTKVAAEEFIESTRRRGDEAGAAAIDALTQDPRMAALLPRQARAIEQNLQDAELKGLREKVAADEAVAALEQAGLEFKRGLDVSEMQRGAAGAEAGRQMLLNAMLQEAAAGPTATQEGIKTTSTLLAALRDFSDLANRNPAGVYNTGVDPRTGSFTTVEEILSGTSSGQGTPVDIDNIELPELTEIEEEDEEFAAGGKLQIGEDGMKTNGEFDHDTNPKAIVDEDTGVKEGEVTGGELIFNPKQSNTMEDLIEKGDAKGLLEFMKDLLAQPQFQA